jgi:type I restriction enzyme S subunit
MSNPNTKKIMPKLRFKQIDGSSFPNWGTSKLNVLANRTTLRNKGAEVTHVFTNSAIEGVVDQREYFDKDIANQNNLENYYIVEHGDYVYNPRISNSAPVGPISKNKLGKGVMSPLYTVFRFKDVNDRFFEQYFKTVNWHLYLRNISNSGARHDRMSISNEDFMNMPLPNPHNEEQKKIADCLSSIDELITIQTKEIAALKAHKKGLMQQLFPAEGETTPPLRFPKFRNDKEWSPTTIGDVGTFYYGKSAPKWSLSNDAPTLCVRYGELYTKFGTVISEVLSRTNIEPSNLRFSKGGEILIPRVGEVPQDFANCCYLPFPNIAIGEMISVYETDEYPIFYAYYFRTMGKQFAKVVEGQNVKNLYYVNLEPIVVGKPSTRLEQQKIADCLSSIDVLISTQTHKLESLKAYKKGLLQQLFPNADEVKE